MNKKFDLKLISRKYTTSTLKGKYDAVVVGGGHNGLTSAAYLSKAGMQVCVLEKRPILGGAAVTEEIIPGFKFSRASYLLSLLRPIVINELKLKDHGLRYYIRNPSSFTPIRDSNYSLLLGLDMTKNQKEIAKFSQQDAENYPVYEKFMEHIVKSIEPLMDSVPIGLNEQFKFHQFREICNFYSTVKSMGLKNIVDFYQLMTAPISKIMDRWFECYVLKATLGTDGIIGFAASPYDAGTGYVLLHHVLGGLDGRTGTWGYVFGGMGTVSNALASAALSHGAELYTNYEVSSILTEDGCVKGVKLANGKEVAANIVLANTTPKITFTDLIEKSVLPQDFRNSINTIDYTSPVTKINVAVRSLPSFSCLPSIDRKPMPHHQTTIHMNCESMQLVHQGIVDYRQGQWSKNPVIEMTIPSAVDRSLVQDDTSHVVSLFTQYTPYKLNDGLWDDSMKEKYATKVFSEIDAYAPNFSSSIIGYEVLPPPELEKIFGLTGGNIFHGSMSLDQLYFTRPVPKFSNYTTPIKGLFLCGSGAHPGGGVTGAPGRLGAITALKHWKNSKKY